MNIVHEHREGGTSGLVRPVCVLAGFLKKIDKKHISVSTKTARAKKAELLYQNANRKLQIGSSPVQNLTKCGIYVLRESSGLRLAAQIVSFGVATTFCLHESRPNEKKL